MAFDYGKKSVLGLHFEERNAEMAKKFATRGFQDIEVARVIYMVTEGAIGVNHAVNVTETSGHGGTLSSQFQIPSSKFEAHLLITRFTYTKS